MVLNNIAGYLFIEHTISGSPISCILYDLITAFLYFLMQFIPMPVLYGVFLYMGVTSLGGVQVSLWLTLRQLGIF